MWQAKSEALDSTTARFRVCWHGAPISVKTALHLCTSDAGFRSSLIRELAQSPFAAYFWETPPVTASSLNRPFEFVLCEALALASAPPDRSAFQEHFGSDEDDDGIVTFENLGRDAILVVPCPLASFDAYAHLAAFVRGAPEAQQHALFRRTADETLARVSDRPLWLSTAGMGVYWLHVRLDSRPKYYRHTPYKFLV